MNKNQINFRPNENKNAKLQIVAAPTLAPERLEPVMALAPDPSCHMSKDTLF